MFAARYAEAGVDRRPHRLGPRLGADNGELEADLVRRHAAPVVLLGQGQRVAGSAGDHRRLEIGDEDELTLGHAA
jgi:hypothetical protein